MGLWNKIKKSEIAKEYSADATDNFFSSKDRIVKTIGVLALPMIYAFTCIFAFWNPVGAIGKTPTAIVNQDQKQLVIGSLTDTQHYLKEPIALSAEESPATRPTEFVTTEQDGTVYIDGEIYTHYLQNNLNAYLWSKVDLNAYDQQITSHPTQITSDLITNHCSVESVMDLFMTKEWQPNNIDGFGYNGISKKFSAKISSKVTMDNIAYISSNPDINCTTDNDPDKYATYDISTREWSVKNSNYYLQIDIPTHFTESIADIVDCTINYLTSNMLSTYLNNLNGAINSYTTYAKSFFIGEIIDQMSPMVIGSIFSNFFSAIPSPIDINPNDFINSDVPNGRFNNYGIGIGEMFMCVGLWVGAFGMTSVMKRNKKNPKLKPWKWYISKGLTMSTLSITQAAILTFCVGCVGWFQLGPTFLLLALFMVFCGLIFTQIIQALWFIFRDHKKASIVMIIYLVLNIAAGGGTFPVFSQNFLFQGLSFLMPFRYAIEAEGATIYGLGAGVNITSNAWYIISRCLILLVFLIVSMTVGMLAAKKRNKEILYGTSKKSQLSYVLSSLKLNKYLGEHGQVDWKKLPNEEQPKWKALCSSLFPTDDKFLWYKKKDIKEFNDLEDA